MTAAGLRPSMEENEALSVRADEQVIGVMLLLYPSQSQMDLQSWQHIT